MALAALLAIIGVGMLMSVPTLGLWLVVGAFFAARGASIDDERTFAAWIGFLGLLALVVGAVRFTD
jgi:hypothetical protein